MKKALIKEKFVAFGKWCENLLFPKDIKCIFCNTDIPDFDNKPFCEDCEKKLKRNVGKKCLICAQPISSEGLVCDFCQTQKRYFCKAYCPLIYEGITRAAILGYKDSNQRYKAKPFAKLIVDEIAKDEIAFDYITFVPMTNKKLKARSFNQSKLLAEEIGRLLNVPVVELFEKFADGKSQKSSTYKERQKNVAGAYHLLKKKLKRDCKILIVDDIITTCATVNQLASLLDRDDRRIYVCAVARNEFKNQKKSQG